MPWRKEWQPTPVFLSGEFHGQRQEPGELHSPLGCKELDMTEWPTLLPSFTFHLGGRNVSWPLSTAPTLSSSSFNFYITDNNLHLCSSSSTQDWTQHLKSVLCRLISGEPLMLYVGITNAQRQDSLSCLHRLLNPTLAAGPLGHVSPLSKPRFIEATVSS